MGASINSEFAQMQGAEKISQRHEKGMLAFALRESQVGGCVVDVLVDSEVPFEVLRKNAVMGELFGRGFRLRRSAICWK